MKNISAKFDDYTLRTVTEDDRARIAEWIAADPAHAKILNPEFFMGQMRNEEGEFERDPRPTCYALEDEGGAVFYIRLSRAARVHIQFRPIATVSDRARVARALSRGMIFLEIPLGRSGTEQWIFETESRPLKALAQLRLGFKESHHELVKPIPFLYQPKGVN